MINDNKILIFDIDGTICTLPEGTHDYSQAIPFQKIIEKIRISHNEGFYIILMTSRNMRTYEGNLGKIMANTAPTLFKWLLDHNVPYDEIHFGKPWCGKNGFYIDDKAIRPTEFINHTFMEINELLLKEKEEWKKINS